jgi:DNA-binding MarR family transcriptional regulator
MKTLAVQRRLEAISEGVGRIRETTEAILDHVKAIDPGVPDRPASEFALELLRLRRYRAEMLGARLFSDPAWDMLLSLFAAGERVNGLSVSELCAASAVPHTTALRWIESLEEQKLVCRRTDASDARRTMIYLPVEAREKMRALLEKAAAELRVRS